MLSTTARIGLLIYRRTLSAGRLLILAITFFAALLAAAQACPPASLPEPKIAATPVTAKHYKMASAGRTVELKATAVTDAYKVVGRCCGSLVSGSICPSFSCSMGSAALPATVLCVSPHLIVRSRGVTDDTGLMFSALKADFRPPRHIA